MPLVKGTSKETIGTNINEMVEHGHPAKQAVAAALHTAHPLGGKDGDPVYKEVREGEQGGEMSAYGNRDAGPVGGGSISLADINRMGRELWSTPNGNIGSVEMNESTLPEHGGKSKPIQVYQGMRDAQAFDEVSPTQSDPPDRRSDNLLEREHGGIPGKDSKDESLVEWAREEEQEKEHK